MECRDRSWRQEQGRSRSPACVCVGHLGQNNRKDQRQVPGLKGGLAFAAAVTFVAAVTAGLI